MAESLRENQSIMRVGSEQIVDDLGRSVRQGNYSDFFNKYTLVANLLIDNIWILQSRPSAAKELGRLIEARMAHGNFTVLASDLVYQDVICTLPAIGDCLKQESAIRLNIVQSNV
jgi:chromosomal replication initiation ATPase DnaA